MKPCRTHLVILLVMLGVVLTDFAPGTAWGGPNEPKDLSPGNPTITLAPRIDAFDEWMKTTGEKAPDFSKLKAMPGLPPLLTMNDGRTVKTPAEWAARRAELRDLLEQWIFGHAPKVDPPAFRAEVLSEIKTASAVDREVKLTYACPKPVVFVVHVMLPANSKGPFPVFMTQWNHREWAAMAVTRGYLACYYPGADENDETPQLARAYPDADWRLLRQRAWMCSRVLDYLVTLPEADRAHVALTGHSRNGKQSLVAAAFDDRITAVVASSAGSGGSVPWRYTSEFYFNESVEVMTRYTPARTWFTPRMRFFTGRENYLPIDNHALLGLIAPRACLISDATNDACGQPLGGEQALLAGREVYKFLGHPEALRILYRISNHETLAKDIENYFDWYDTAFGRMQREFPEEYLHVFDWQAWRSRQDATSLQIAKNAGVKEKITWALGEAPAAVRMNGNTYGAFAKPTQALVNREMPEPTSAAKSAVARLGFSFGEYVSGDLYYPRNARGPLPVVIWLHPCAPNYGYNASQNVGPKIYDVLARKGFLVVAFDQVGYGVREFEKPLFYTRYPRWSLLGKMVHDVQASLDCILSGKPTADGQGLQHDWMEIPPLDPKRVSVVGYGMGGMVGLYAAALDPRITAVASFCGFTPMRTDTAAKPDGGLRRLWELYALQPRLGLYDGHEGDLPYDYDDVLKLVAPRPCLVYAPLFDREADAADVKRCVESARGAWSETGRGDGLRLEQPADFNRFQLPQHAVLLEWLGVK